MLGQMFNEARDLSIRPSGMYHAIRTVYGTSIDDIYHAWKDSLVAQYRAHVPAAPVSGT